jgi:hypothetical protein
MAKATKNYGKLPVAKITLSGRENLGFYAYTTRIYK